MLKLLLDAKHKKLRGVYVYYNNIVDKEPLIAKKPCSDVFLCDYCIEDNAWLRAFVKYFLQTTKHHHVLTVLSFKHLPIKPEDKDA
jgi:hypothetical protein